MRKIMKYVVPIFLVGLLLALTGCSSGTTNVAASPQGQDVVSGVLRDAGGAPIVGAVVKSSWATATTDSTGTWNLGLAPVVTNSGATGLAVSTFAVSINTSAITSPVNMTLTPKPTAVYPTTVYRFVSTSSAGGNNLIVGQNNVTVMGMVTDSRGGVPAGAVSVQLSYVASATPGSTGNAIGGNPLPAVTASATTGIFTITGVENGSSFILTASATIGGYPYTVQTGTIGPIPTTAAAYTYTGGNPGLPLAQGTTTLKFNATPDIFPATTSTTLGAPTIKVGTADPVLNPGNGDFTPGATTLRWAFSYPYIMVTPYTATSSEQGVTAAGLDTVYKGIYVNVTNKAGNVPFAVTYENDATGKYITAVNVTFTTAISALYEVNLANPAGGNSTIQAASFLANLIDLRASMGLPRPFIAGNTTHVTSRVLFSTNGAPAVPAVGALRLRAAVAGATSDSAASVTFDWAPAAGAKFYNAYSQMTQTYVDGSTAVHDWTLQGSGANAQMTTLPLSFYQTGIITPGSTTNGAVALSYLVSVVGVNSDGIEGAAQLPASMVTFSPANLNPVATVTNAFMPSATAVSKAQTAAGAPVVLRSITKVAAAGTGEAYAAAFYNNVAGTLTAATLVSVVNYTAYMTKAQVETIANWGIVGVQVGGGAVANIATITGGTQPAGTGVAVTATISSVVYDVTLRQARVTYTLGYAATAAVAADAAGTVYTISVPTFNFTNTGITDLERSVKAPTGNVVTYATGTNGF